MRQLAAAVAAVAALAALSACATREATSRPLPKERATECAANCETLGMSLAAVVIIMDAAGCVCEPRGAAPATSRAPGAGAVMGGAAVAYVAAKAQRQQQETRSPMEPAMPRPSTGVPVPRY